MVPNVPLENINGVPIVILKGTLDLIADLQDVQWVEDQLGENIVESLTYDYGHMSFMVAKDMSYMDDVLRLMAEYPQLQ